MPAATRKRARVSDAGAASCGAGGSAEEASPGGEVRLRRRRGAGPAPRSDENAAPHRAAAEALDDGALQREIERASSLEASLAREREARRVAEGRVRELQKAAAAATAAADVELRSAAAEAEAVRAARRAAEDAADEARRAAVQRESEIEGRAAVAEAEAKENAAALASLEEELERMTSRATKAELAAARAERSAAAGAGDAALAARNQELEGLAKELRAELAACAEDTKAARSQLAKRHNADLMRERVTSAETMAERAKAAEAAARTEADSLAAQVTTLQDELARWKALLVDVPGLRPEVPEDLPRLISQLQREEAAARKQKGDAEARVAEIQSVADAAGARAEAAEARATAAQASAADAKAAALRAEGAAAAAAAERDGMRRVVQSFEEEMAAAPGASGVDAGAKAIEGAQAAHIARLDEALAGAQARVASLESDLAQRDSDMQAARAETAKEAEEVASQRAINAEAQREVERLGKQVATLEKRVARGEYNPARTKIVHLAAPPEVMRLQAENAALREQLEASSTAAGAAPATSGADAEAPVAATPMAKTRPGKGTAAAPAFTPARTPMAGLRTPGPRYAGDAEARVAELEKFLARYKTVFKDQISAFREACFFLYGYKMDVDDVAAPKVNSADAQVGVALATKRFTLTSRFAKDSSECMVFNYVPGHGLEMLPNPYSKSMQMEVDTFINKFRSIPAFLANHTMEAFNAATSA